MRRCRRAAVAVTVTGSTLMGGLCAGPVAAASHGERPPLDPHQLAVALLAADDLNADPAIGVPGAPWQSADGIHTASTADGSEPDGYVCEQGAGVAAAPALAAVDVDQVVAAFDVDDPEPAGTTLSVTEVLMAFTTPAAAGTWTTGHDSCVGQAWQTGSDPIDYVTQTALSLPPLGDASTAYLQHYAHRPGGPVEHFSSIAVVRLHPLVVLALSISADTAPDRSEASTLNAVAAVAVAKAQRVLDVWLDHDGPISGPISRR